MPSLRVLFESKSKKDEKEGQVEQMNTITPRGHNNQSHPGTLYEHTDYQLSQRRMDFPAAGRISRGSASGKNGSRTSTSLTRTREQQLVWPRVDVYPEYQPLSKADRGAAVPAQGWRLKYPLGIVINRPAPKDFSFSVASGRKRLVLSMALKKAIADAAIAGSMQPGHFLIVADDVLVGDPDGNGEIPVLRIRQTTPKGPSLASYLESKRTDRRPSSRG